MNMKEYQLAETLMLGYAEAAKDLAALCPAALAFFWDDAWAAHDQAAHDPHKWGERPALICSAIEQMTGIPAEVRRGDWRDPRRFSEREIKRGADDIMDIHLGISRRYWAWGDAHTAQSARELLPTIMVGEEGVWQGTLTCQTIGDLSPLSMWETADHAFRPCAHEISLHFKDEVGRTWWRLTVDDPAAFIGGWAGREIPVRLAWGRIDED